MNLFSPRTVRGWFVLIVMGALLLSQLVSLALMVSQQTILRSSLHHSPAPSGPRAVIASRVAISSACFGRPADRL